MVHTVEKRLDFVHFFEEVGLETVVMVVNLWVDFYHWKRALCSWLWSWSGQVLGEHREDLVEEVGPFDRLGLNKKIFLGEALIAQFMILSLKIGDHFIFLN